MSLNLRNKKFDLIYIEGPGDLVESFRRWYNKEDVITETSRTFSGQFFDFCKEKQLKTYAISYCNNVKQEETADFYVENRPKINLNMNVGILYHLVQILYGLWIVGIVIRYRPKYLSLTSGVTYWFILAPIKLLGIKIIPQLHNSLWPKGFRPQGWGKRIQLALDGWFFRHIVSNVLCVSPELKRQVQSISGIENTKVTVFFPQFNQNDFNHISKFNHHITKPFNIVFAGRIERNKGVFDLLAIMDQLREEAVVLEICGEGSDLSELENECKRLDLDNRVHIHGILNRPDLLNMYASSHVIIVPTHNDFGEAFAMVAVEAVLMGKPVICSSVVPAAEVLGGCAIVVPANDIAEYVKTLHNLISDKNLYENVKNNCELISIKDQFYDNKMGLTAAMDRIYING